MTSLQALGLAYRKANDDLYYSCYVLLDAIAGYKLNLAFKDAHHETDS